MLQSRYAVVVVIAVLTACGGHDTSKNNNTQPAPEATLVTIAVSASTSSIVPGATLQLTATGHYDDQSTQDLTATATWFSSAGGIAAVSTTGLVTGVANGAATINAAVGSIRGALSITVVQHVPDAVITSIAITPANPTIGVSSTQQMTATATYNNATTQDISSQASWSTADNTTVEVSQAGLVTGVKVGGPIKITAELDAVSGSTNVSVNGIGVSAFAPSSTTHAVRQNGQIAVTFSAPMNASTVTVQATSGACSGKVQLSCDNFATCVGLSTPTFNSAGDMASMTPAAALPALATCAIRVKSGVVSSDGASLASDVTQSGGFTTATDGPCAASLVISQVYAGGGGTGATYNRDFIELHNQGATGVSVNGWSIQYANATATTWTATSLPNATVAAGDYFLIGLATGASGSTLPGVDATSTTDMAIAGGKVALVAGTTALSGTCPLAQTIDFYGYGTANCAEGTAGAALTATTSALRGCTDGNNSTDFTNPSAPTADNSGTPSNVCICYDTSGTAEIDTCAIAPATLSTTVGTPTSAITVTVHEAGLTEAAGSNAAIKAEVGVGATASTPDGTWTFSAAAFLAQDADGVSDDYTGTVVGPSPAGGYSYVGRATRDSVNWTLCDLDGNGSTGGASFDTAQEGALTTN